VTVLWDFSGLPDGERMPLLNTIKKRCGTGGKLLGQTMEIQGDQRDFLTKFLGGHDFYVIWAGG
jgi:translation initiation factor 1